MFVPEKDITYLVDKYIQYTYKRPTVKSVVALKMEAPVFTSTKDSCKNLLGLKMGKLISRHFQTTHMFIVIRNFHIANNISYYNTTIFKEGFSSEPTIFLTFKFQKI